MVMSRKHRVRFRHALEPLSRSVSAALQLIPKYRATDYLREQGSPRNLCRLHPH